MLPSVCSTRAVRWCWIVVLLVPLVLAGCDQGPNRENGDDAAFNLDNCTIPTGRLASGCEGPDCIPALSRPELTAPGEEDAGYLSDTSRVIGLLFGEEALAVPHNILWFHEIANFTRNGRSFAVTYCPLTGSSLAFDRGAVDGAELRVSGLLFDNNLVMYDRREDRSLWPQMNRQAKCGANVGEALSMVPIVEMQWERWKALHPDTKVVSSRTPYARDYRESNYPYRDYERPGNDRVLFDMPIDDRRPPKERVLGIPSDSGGVALPFGALDTAPARVVTVAVGGTEKTVFWSRRAQGAMAFETSAAFSVDGKKIVDDETGSTWTIEGRAVAGPRKGDRLDPVDEAYVAFWFAWAAFQPETTIWTPSS